MSMGSIAAFIAAILAAMNTPEIVVLVIIAILAAVVIGLFVVGPLLFGPPPEVTYRCDNCTRTLTRRAYPLAPKCPFCDKKQRMTMVTRPRRRHGGGGRL